MNEAGEPKGYVYFVLVRANTVLGRVARALGHYEYTHAAICLDKPFRDFITFSRRKHYDPFDCGFMHETLDCYAYGRHRRVKLKLHAVPVGEKELRAIRTYLKELEVGETSFNLYSMLTMGLLHGLPIAGSENCMSFCARVLSLTGAVRLKKPYYRYDLRELDCLLTEAGFFYREVTVGAPREETPGYMEPVPPIRVLKHALELNAGLLRSLKDR